MGGIYAVFHKLGASPATSAVRKLEAGLASWGRGKLTSWQRGPVGVGGISSANARAVSSSSAPELVVVADARIDNRGELGDWLGLHTAELGSIDDSGLILAAWAKSGPACVPRLHGAFAFVVWDVSAQTMHLVRDHLGLRPLHYHDSSERFAAATDAAVLVGIDGVPDEVDESLVDAYWLGIRRPFLDRSLLRDVWKVSPGHTLEVSVRKLERRRWTPGEGPNLRFRGAEDYTARLRELLVEATAQRVECPRPVASHLSGGLDSSLVTVLAARSLRERGKPMAHAYSWFPSPSGGPDDPHSDARALIDAVCRQEGIACLPTDLAVEDVAAYLWQDIARAPSDWQHYERLVCRDAEARGIGVILSGLGGDEGVSSDGAGLFAGLVGSGDVASLVREGSKYVAEQGRRSVRRRARMTLRLMARATVPFVPDEAYGWFRHHLRRDRRYRILIDEYRRRYGGMPPWEPRARQLGVWSRERRSVRLTQIERLTNGYLTVRLESWAWLAARHNLDYRYPLLDRRVLDHCLSIPEQVLARGDNPRSLFRRAAAGLLPPAVLDAGAVSEEARHQALIRMIDEAAATGRGDGSRPPRSAETTPRGELFMDLWSAVERRLNN